MGTAKNCELFSQKSSIIDGFQRGLSQPAFFCAKLTIKALEQGVKYVQS